MIERISPLAVSVNTKPACKAGRPFCSSSASLLETAASAEFCADGESYVEGVDLALRGYNDLATKLRSLGLKFEVIEA